ncbi:hypothetical protein RN001_006724 [Aquatica leii]|uniref:Uncharacterized protein n=1 Tax=Aquatica leii TaxID=1421715 RepID=A0AAN7P8I7_9COLE|nr:hypothetical protein RN001_006724 [Aquatica leii]
MKNSENHLDTILTEVGEFGRYQRQILLLLMLTIGLIFFSNVIYIFEAKQVKHRCFIPSCENETSPYLAPWLMNAVPFKDGKPERCAKYQQINKSGSSCAISDFNTSIIEKCERFVYETPEISIMHDFDLHCDENVKKLAFVGTVNGIGKFIGLPIAGYISDKYGRKKIFICSMVVSGLFVFDSFFISGAYASVFVLAAELVGPRKRVLVNTLMIFSYGLGSMCLGGVVWLLQSWRLFLRIIYGLFILSLTGNWLMPESLRWLIMHKKYDELSIVLKKIAKVNGKSISYSGLKKLTETVDETETATYPVNELLRSRILLTRCICCSFCWIACLFVYYGQSITSVTLSGDAYLDFILCCLIEIPACVITYFLVDRIGRRLTLSSGYTLACIFSVILIFTPTATHWIKLTIFLMGKFGISITMNVIYMITNEMFPHLSDKHCCHCARCLVELEILRYHNLYYCKSYGSLHRLLYLLS